MAHRHEPRLVAFASHAQNSLVEIQILEPRVGQFGNTQSACVKQFDHRPVSQSVKSFRIDALDQLLDLQFVQRFGQVTFDPWESKSLSCVSLDGAFTSEK